MIKKIKASEGHILPIFYKGSIIRISDKEEVEIDFDQLLHEPKLQLEKAILKKNVIVIGDK